MASSLKVIASQHANLYLLYDLLTPLGSIYDLHCV